LPSAWIDRIFSVLTARFGRDFLGRWEGIQLDIVKADWAEQLAGLQSRPDAIKYALDNVGTKAPNVAEFKELCGRAPVDGLLALRAPKASDDVIEKAVAIARAALLTRNGGHLDTLRDLAESDARDGTYRGQPVTMAQRQTYRQALGMNRVMP
jgi:hypothetical protein